ncbi:MAG: hypothetical protein V2A71_04965, partial [Candidatus Eisenbacteria bacterium]
MKARATVLVLVLLFTLTASAVHAQKMYWTDMGHEKIRRANLNGTTIQNLIISGIGASYGIALDVQPPIGVPSQDGRLTFRFDLLP